MASDKRRKQRGVSVTEKERDERNRERERKRCRGPEKHTATLQVTLLSVCMCAKMWRKGFCVWWCVCAPADRLPF